jgi:hypothetical protein
MQAQKKGKWNVIQRWFDVRERWWRASQKEAKERLRPDRKRPPHVGTKECRVVRTKV